MIFCFVLDRDWLRSVVIFILGMFFLMLKVLVLFFFYFFVLILIGWWNIELFLLVSGSCIILFGVDFVFGDVICM